ncbi:MAG: DUF1573 domain-containing protein [Sedimentisphaerales bacterium]|nr:DUF1573 domain-containing protein [Sedimentisphaerales bacterium]
MKTYCLIVLILSICSLMIFIGGCEEKAAVTKPTTVPINIGIEQADQQATTEAELAETLTEQNEKEVQTTDKTEQGTVKIVLEKDVYDFGMIDPGTKNKGEFNFTNEGNGVLRISKIQSTCGCTVPEMKKKTYLPGESGTIVVTYTADQRSGPVSKSLYILSNDPKNPRFEFHVKAEIVKKINYEPKQLSLRFDKENAGVKDIKIESLDKKPFAISRITVKPECMNIDFDPAAEGTSFTLIPKVNIEKLKGVHSGAVNFYLTHPAQRTLTIGFEVLPPFKSDPATLIALNADPDKPVRKVLYILSNYGEDFEVESVKTSNDIIQIVSEEKMQGKYMITLDIVAPESAGNRRHFNSKLEVKIAGEQTLTISCVGSIKKNT